MAVKKTTVGRAGNATWIRLFPSPPPLLAISLSRGAALALVNGPQIILPTGTGAKSL